MTRTRTRRCAHCGQEFSVPRKPGPAPKYCSQAHRQQAYQQRRGTTRYAELTDQITELQAHVRRLDYDNQRLREELTRTEAEMVQLYRAQHPVPPGKATLIDLANPAADLPPPTPERRRRRNRDTD